jgi:hypothetical protein
MLGTTTRPPDDALDETGPDSYSRTGVGNGSDRPRGDAGGNRPMRAAAVVMGSIRILWHCRGRSHGRFT